MSTLLIILVFTGATIAFSGIFLLITCGLIDWIDERKGEDKYSIISNKIFDIASLLILIGFGTMILSFPIMGIAALLGVKL